MQTVLKLEPLEWFMFENGGQPRCLSFFIRVVFSGSFDSAAFETAVSRALSRHPLLRANVVGSRLGNLMWVPAANPLGYLNMAPATVPMQFASHEAIDLRTETGVRIWARHLDNETEWRFQFHHACCDGIGALQFIEDVMCAYDQVVNGGASHAAMRPLQERALSNRGMLQSPQTTLRHRLKRSLIVRPRRMAKNVTDKPYTISAEAEHTVDAVQRTLPTMPFHKFSRAETRQLRHVAHAHGASANDLLVRELALAVNQSRLQTDAAPTSPIRILVPYSLRGQNHDLMSAANAVSMVSITRYPTELENHENLLRGITREMQYIHHWQIEQNWLRTLARVGRLPCSKLLLCHQAKRTLASSILTNVGKLFARATLPRRSRKIQIGQLCLQRVDGGPPASGSTPVTFCCSSYAGELVMVVNYDPRRATLAAANELLDEYVKRLKGVATERPIRCAA